MTLRRSATAALLVTAALAWPAPPAFASGCDASGEAETSALGIGLTCSTDPVGTPATSAVSSKSDAEPTFTAYRWVNVCIGGFTSEPDAVVDCAAARTCPDTGARLWRLWGREPSGRWQPLYTQCRGGEAGDAPLPDVTPGLVLEALRRIGLPSLRTYTQPEDKTLVNFDTIFYTHPTVFRRTITLLGQRVEVEATPARYTWRPGDGTARTTTTPGRPYPATDVTHRYRRAHRTVQAAVDVTYTARYRLAGGNWRDITPSLTITGPPTPLRVAEATPVLSGEHG